VPYQPWIERELACSPQERAAAWSKRPGTMLLRDSTEAGQSVLLFQPRWSFWLGSNGRYCRRGPVPTGLPLVGAPATWPLRWVSGLRRLRRRHPLYCGIAGALGFELGGLPFGAVAARPPLVDTPPLWLALYDRALIFGRGAPRLVVADLDPLCPDGRSLQTRWEEARAQLCDAQPSRPPASPRPIQMEALDPVWHRAGVERIQRYLRAGDAYQVNLTGQILVHADVDPFELFWQETQANPVAQAAFLRLDDATISSHSPELLLRLRRDVALSSPIKGTAPSGDSDLLLREKDRAEHVMIVDLVRNDLGRSAVVGSVHVREFFRRLELRGLEHLVSDVESRLRPGARRQVLADLFPGGSITGAPKRRAIEIIAELEPRRRGIYTGSIGFADAAGFAEWNIAIRTAVWQNGRVAFGCGGGIVLDSEPEREYAEAMLKAQSFLDSLSRLSRAAAVGACSSTTKAI
jgi:para-aminobenzoate synthetase component 1